MIIDSTKGHLAQENQMTQWATPMRLKKIKIFDQSDQELPKGMLIKSISISLLPGNARIWNKRIVTKAKALPQEKKKSMPDGAGPRGWKPL